MNRTTKTTVGAVMFVSLFLTACGSNVPNDKDPKPFTGATSSASASASASVPATTPPATAPALDESMKGDNPLGAPAVSEAEAKKNLAELANKPLGADVDAMFANPERVSPQVLTVFPEDKHNTKQVVREAMATYQDLVIIEQWHQARPEGFKNDGDMLDVHAEKIDVRFIEQVKKTAAENKAGSGLTNHFIVSSLDGVFAPNATEKYKVTKDAFSASFNEPSVQIINLGNVEQPVDVIRIETDMHYSYKLVGTSEATKDFKGKFTGTATVNIDVLPLENGQWIIKNIGRAQSVDTALVADAKVPND